MLPDECERVARAFAIAANAVRPLDLDLRVARTAHALSLERHHLIVAQNEAMPAPEFCFAEALPEVHANRAAGRCEVGEDDVITDRDWCDQEHGSR